VKLKVCLWPGRSKVTVEDAQKGEDVLVRCQKGSVSCLCLFVGRQQIEVGANLISRGDYYVRHINRQRHIINRK
jgi:hypothetical protein